MRKVWRGTDVFSVKTDLYRSRCLQLKSLKQLQIYTHCSSVTFVCVIHTFYNGLVHGFHLYLIHVQLLIVKVCSAVFSCVSGYMCNRELTTPCFTTQVFLHMPPWAAEHQHALCLASWGKGSSEMRRLSHAMQCAREAQPWCTGMSCPQQFPHLLLLLRAAVTTARRVNNKKKVANQTVCTEGKRIGQRCLKTDVVWPWIFRIGSHIYKVCLATLQNTARCQVDGYLHEDAMPVFASCCNFLLCFPPSLVYNKCTCGNTGKSLKGKSNPWSRHKFKSLRFWKALQQEQVLPLTQTGANCRIGSDLQALFLMVMSIKSLTALCS